METIAKDLCRAKTENLELKVANKELKEGFSWIGYNENVQLKKDNDKLREEIASALKVRHLKDYWFGKGYDEAKSEFFVDMEFLDEKDEEIETLKKELVLLRGE